MVSLKDWKNRLRTSSTKRAYMLYVQRFLDFHGITWQQTQEWTVDEAEDRCLAFREHMIQKGFAGKTILIAVSALKKWFWDNRIRIRLVPGVTMEKTFLDYIPSKADVQILLDSARPHVKLGIAIMAFSGLRPIDCVTLQFKHIKASFNSGDEVLTMIKRHRKTREWYPSFLGPQGTRYLRDILKFRRRKGEKIKDDSFIVSWQGEAIPRGTLSKAIGRLIARTIGRHPTGEPFRKFRAYGLRKYFRRAVSKMGDAEAEFLMGHIKGLQSLEATYGGLRDMDPQAIAELKKKYVLILPDLETDVPSVAIQARIEHLEAKESELEDMRQEIADLRRLVDALREIEEAKDLAEELDDS